MITLEDYSTTNLLEYFYILHGIMIKSMITMITVSSKLDKDTVLYTAVPNNDSRKELSILWNSCFILIFIFFLILSLLFFLYFSKIDGAPRVWDESLERPGCAFTRSLGDSVAEECGVCAEPEVFFRISLCFD